MQQHHHHVPRRLPALVSALAVSVIHSVAPSHRRTRHECQAQYALCFGVVDFVEDDSVAGQDALDLRFEEVAHDLI